MYLLFDGDLANPEIEFSASVTELIGIGHQLAVLGQEMEIIAEESKSKFYPENLKSVIFRFSNEHFLESINSVSISIEDQKLILSGSQEDIHNLGISILNVFDENSQTNEHFHLDYFEENVQKASLIIICKNL